MDILKSTRWAMNRQYLKVKEFKQRNSGHEKETIQESSSELKQQQ